MRTRDKLILTTLILGTTILVSVCLFITSTRIHKQAIWYQNVDPGLRSPAVFGMDTTPDMNSGGYYYPYTFAAFINENKLVILIDHGSIASTRIAAIGVTNLKYKDKDYNKLYTNNAILINMDWFAFYHRASWYFGKNYPGWLQSINDTHYSDLNYLNQNSTSAILPIGKLNEKSRSCLISGEDAIIIWFSNGLSPSVLIPRERP
jgi:hypothetical protein